MRIIFSLSKWVLVFLLFFVINTPSTANAAVWLQSVGLDIRWDKITGYPNTITPPLTFTSTAGLGTAGVVFSGILTDGSLTPWKVGGAYPDLYTDSHSFVPTSFDILKNTASVLTNPTYPIVDIGSKCSTPNQYTNCTVSSLVSGTVYTTPAGTSLTLNAYSPPAAPTGNYIILVNGNLTINGNIIIPVGSTAIFSAKGNITVSSGVTEIDGLYSADGDFNANSTTCPLSVKGAVVANAGRSGKTFNETNNCGNSPSVVFTERPDFLLNYPSLVKYTPRTWQESF